MGMPRRFLRPGRPRTPGARGAVLTMSAVGILPFDAFDSTAAGRRGPAVLGSLTAGTAGLDTALVARRRVPRLNAKTTDSTPGLAAALDLFDPARRPAEPDVERGY